VGRPPGRAPDPAPSGAAAALGGAIAVGKEDIVLSAEQKNHFETFGFLLMPRYYSADEASAISQAFDDVLDHDRQGQPFRGDKRQAVLGVIEKHPVLTSLADDDRIYEPIEQLLGPDFVWIGSDGNLYVGDTRWHPDSDLLGYGRIKVAFYLDPVTRDTGCLRVVPGSHRPPLHDDLKRLREPGADPTATPFGVAPRDLPQFPLESQPGDVVFFNQALWHASFGGRTGRRMFTLNFGAKPTTEEHVANLRQTYEFNLGYTKQAQYTQTDRVYEESFLHSDRPRIRGMVSRLVEWGFK
jgi:ectoine hydroxylase-related dioxygenase (phytanoyl-CoA dioxygenase family)